MNILLDLSLFLFKRMHSLSLSPFLFLGMLQREDN